MRLMAQCSLAVILLIEINWMTIAGFEQATTSQKEISLESYIREASGKLSRRSGHRKVMALIIRFVNFGCVFCLDDFFEFCDTLKASVPAHGQGDIILMVVRDQRDEATQARIMKGWARSNGLKFPVYLIPEDIVDNYYIDYTSVVVIDERGTIVVVEKFPIGMQRKKEIMRYFSEVGK